MVENILIITCLIYLTSLPLTAAQLPETERLINVTECDIKATINLACAADEMIAIHSLQYAYHVLCESTCCNTYDSSNCFVNGDSTDIQDLRRSCSGKTSCVVPSLKENTAFCAVGVKPVSYVFLQYYCIPKSRTVSICGTSKSLTSDDAPLYITNENYPGVTTRSDSCSCSLEAYSCSSTIHFYIIDADLYHETSSCEQNVVFKNGTDATLKTIGCENYYTDNITSRNIGSHFSRIDFINNSTSNQEGLFFVGLKASEAGVTFRLDCTSKPETWCIGCGALQNIANGNIELHNVNDSSYGAQADVNCDNGYGTSTPTITCLANSTWPDAVCTQKAACTANQWRCTNGDCITDSQRCDNLPDCLDDSDEQNCAVSPVCPEGLESCLHSNGSSICVDKNVGCVCETAPVIENGDITLRDNSTIGSVADVTCNYGYVTSTPNVTCLTSGLWEPASCTVIDCGTVPALAFGKIVLTDSSNKTFGATARVVCAVGYQASTESVMCLSTGAWLSASCVIKDCGPVPKVKFGSVTLDIENKTTFAATASVTCRTGYYTSKKTIMCQASGQWEKPMCKDRVTTTPPSGGAEEKQSPLNLPLIIVLVVLAVVLIVQLLIVSFLQCKIYAIRRKGDNKNAEFPKRLLMIIAGSIPILGCIAIYFSWKVFNREVYHVQKEGHRNNTRNEAKNKARIRKSTQNNTFSMNDISMATTNPIFDYNGSNITLHEDKDHEEAVNAGSIHLEGPEITACDAPHEENPPSVNDLTNEEDSANYDHFKNDLQQGTEQSTNHAQHQGNAVPHLSAQQKNANHYQHKDEVHKGANNQGETHLNGPEQKANHAPLQENAVSHTTTQQNSHHDQGTGSAMTRGLSAMFEDVQDDMNLGRVAPVMHHATSKKPKLPPIQQHPEDDHHHHHFSKDVEDRRRELQPVIDQARKDDKHVELVREKLFINNCLYQPENTSHDAHIDHHPTHSNQHAAYGRHHATHSNQHATPTDNHGTHSNHRVAHGNQHATTTDNHGTHSNHGVAHGNQHATPSDNHRTHNNQHATHNNQHAPRTDHHVTHNNHHDTNSNHHATQSDQGRGRPTFP